MSREFNDWIGCRPGDVYRSPAGILFYVDSHSSFHVIDSMGQVVDPPQFEEDLFPAVRVAKNPASRKSGKKWSKLTGEWAAFPSELKTGDVYLSNVGTRLMWKDAWGVYWTVDDEGTASAVALAHPFPAQHLAGQNRDTSAIKQPRHPEFSVGNKVQPVKPNVPVFTVERLDSEPIRAGEKHTYIVVDADGVSHKFAEDAIVSAKIL